MVNSFIVNLLKSKRCVLYFSISILVAYGFYHYAVKEERNQCEMTFMYQFPQFIPVPLRHNVSKKFPNYNLYIYGEGEYALYLREGMFYGIPVLFVPGSAGSYKQVRSFGSIALRMAEERLLPHHFNFFTIDFNEELSGLYGDKLQDQTEFLFESVEAIKKLYLRAGRNNSLIVIGHSIGGLISRGLFTMPNFDPTSVDLLITLATPHKQPALFIDTQMYNYYHKVASFWKTNRNSTQFKHLTIISFGGGFHDKLVKSELTQLPDLLPSSGDINMVTTAVSDVWVSTDHQCIVWCRQLIVKLAKLIFELADSKLYKIIPDVTRRSQIISYHLINRNRGANNNQMMLTKMKMSSKGSWIFYDHRYFTFHRNRIIEATFLVMPLTPRTNVILLSSNILRSDWVFGCNASIININGTTKTICEIGDNLTHMTRLIQKTFGNERKVFKQESDKLIAAGHTHLIVYIGPTVGPVSVIGERYSYGRRNKAIVMPTFLDSLMSLLWTSINILEIPVAEEAIFYNLTLIGFNQIWHNYNLKVDVRACYPSAFEYGIVQFWVPWSNEDTTSQIAPTKEESITMNLRLNIPKQDPDDPKHPHLYLMLDPNCGYVVKISFSYKEVLSQLIRHYFNSFLPLVTAILLSVLSIQIIPQHDENKVSGPLTKTGFIQTRDTFQPLSMILKNNFWNISIFFLLPLWTIIIDQFYRLVKQTWNISTSFDIISPYSDASLSNAQKISLHTCLYLFSYSLLFVIAAIIDLFNFYFTHFVVLFIRLFSANKISNLVQCEPKIFKIKVIPTSVTITILLLGILTCSSFCLLAIFAFFLFKLISTSIIACFSEIKKGATEQTTIRYVDATLLLLICAATAPTVPTAVVWFKDYFLRNKFHQTFPDPHILPTYLFAIASGILLHSDYFPSRNKLHLNTMSLVFKLLALMTLSSGLVAYSYITSCISFSFIFYSFFRLSTMWFRKEPAKQD